MKNFGLRAGWHEHAIMGKFGWGLGWRTGWWKWLTSAQSSWRVMRLRGHLGIFFFFFFIISIDTQVWNVLSVCHEWKSTSSSEDTTSMLRILFLSAMTGSTGCITENWVLHTLTHKKKQYVTSCYHYWPELWSTWMVDMESVQRKWSIIWIKQFKWQL